MFPIFFLWFFFIVRYIHFFIPIAFLFTTTTTTSDKNISERSGKKARETTTMTTPDYRSNQDRSKVIGMNTGL